MESSAQTSNLIQQSFEENISIQSKPLEFLPGWVGNEVRGSSSRIFQIEGEGIGGSRALAIQPISTFDGELTVQLELRQFPAGEIRFYAKSIQNGTGNRPADVFYSWGEGGEFLNFERLGAIGEFANMDKAFKEFRLQIPPELFGSIAFLRFEVRYGEGAGTAARWVLDDFEYGVFEEDTIAPKVLEVKGFDSNEVLLQFSEPLDPVFSQFLISYDLEGLEPESVTILADSLVNLSFNESLEEGRTYALNVSQIPDVAGNFLVDTTLNFDFFDPREIPRKGLVINEVMPSPKADLDLPNGEFVELYHAGSKSFRLKEVNWQVGERESVLPEIWIDPDEYVLLVPQNQKEVWERFGRVIPVDNWPTLLNSGATLTLENKGLNVDQLSYASNSWGNSDLANGGYSLEVVNPFLICNQSELLLPSQDDLRGTPGKENSVLDLTQDLLGPNFLSYRFRDTLVLEFKFDEGISEGVLPEDIRFSDSQIPDSIVVSGTSITVYFQVGFEENRIYQLLELNIFDCFGNPYSGELPLRIILPKPASNQDVKINELLFDPITGDPKYVELANASQDYIEIGNWYLANLDDFGEADDLEQLSIEGLVLPPLSFIALSTDSAKLKIRYPKSSLGVFHQMKSLPSYPISGGSVVLLNSNQEVVESFEYSEDLHHPLLRDSKGVSLERISILQPPSEAQNWQSASGNQDFGTPGRKNSQVFSSELAGELIKIDPEVFDPEGSNGQTFTTISYSLDQNGWIGSFRIYDLNGRLIQSLAQNQVLGSEGFYIWTGTDSQGKRVKVGYYILLVELFNPSGEVQVLKKTVVIGQRL